MGSQMNRRDFLKGISTLPLLPLLGAGIHSVVNEDRESAQADKPNILIIVFDALSARNMSLYGYPRQTTANLERFAQRPQSITDTTQPTTGRHQARRHC